MLPHSMLLMLCALFAAVESVNPCDRTLIRDVTAEEVNYNSTTKVLTCKDGSNSLMAIEFNSTLYESLSCDEVDGWKEFNSGNETKNETTIASASEPISVKCVEYCTVESRTGIYTFLDYFDGVKKIDVTCDEGMRLFINGKYVIGGHAACTINSWTAVNKHVHSIDTPLPAECRRGCTQGDRTDVIMSLSSDKESKTVFKSSKPEEDGDKHGVSVNGKVYSYLECDSIDGFTDKDGNIIARDSFASVDLNHDIVPTTTTPVPTTTTTTGETTTPSGVEPPAPAPPGPSAPSKDESSEDAEERTSPGVIGVSIAALILIVIVIVMISIVVKKKQPENKESKSKSDSSNSSEKKSKKKRMSSGKDDISTEVKLEKPVKF